MLTFNDWAGQHGGMAAITEYRTVRVTSLAQAIRFIEERS